MSRSHLFAVPAAVALLAGLVVGPSAAASADSPPCTVAGVLPSVYKLSADNIGVPASYTGAPLDYNANLTGCVRYLEYDAERVSDKAIVHAGIAWSAFGPIGTTTWYLSRDVGPGQYVLTNGSGIDLATSAPVQANDSNVMTVKFASALRSDEWTRSGAYLTMSVTATHYSFISIADQQWANVPVQFEYATPNGWKTLKTAFTDKTGRVSVHVHAGLHTWRAEVLATPTIWRAITRSHHV